MRHLRLTVVGLGPGGIEHVTIGVLRRLGAGGRLFVRTRRHPAVVDLEAMGFAFESFDDLYETIPDYDALYDAIARRLVAAAQGGSAAAGDPSGPPRPAGEQPSAADREIVYAVPGHPAVAESSVVRLVELAGETGISIEVVPGLSWLDAAWVDLRLDPTGMRNLTVVDALDESTPFSPDRNYLISHVYHPLVAGTLKIRLMEAFPEDHPVVVFQAGGTGVPGQKRATVPLHELDRIPWLDHLTSAWVRAAGEPDATAYPLDPLVETMRALRAENGCPWDREQSHESLKPYLIEEAYEVWDAIDEGDPEKFCDELGDLLLQIVFHAQIADEAGAFDANDVVSAIVAKLVRRHPHVFGEVTVSGANEVVVNWEKIKRGEQGTKTRRSALDGVPRHLPALLTAQKIQGKAARTGFEWPTFSGAVDKLWEEAKELRGAIAEYRRATGEGEPGPPDETVASPDPAEAQSVATARAHLEEEIGDLLFAVVNLSRYLHVNAEVALRRTISKFGRRFRRMEELARAEGKPLGEFGFPELLDLWQAAKRR